MRNQIIKKRELKYIEKENVILDEFWQVDWTNAIVIEPNGEIAKMALELVKQGHIIQQMENLVIMK
ncbi:hypothetical protein FDB50_15500 [Clostridium botulinum]|uniref:Uncharacterized protein n=1 Tax=Clostridium botulinum TaxID=1491 RepID=A0A846JYL3_CLOBO|nr:hypothetical protein [Clostridium botulinum]NFN06109.1 hypothetical protein [Clostridium botulinum]NFN36445.1 hypothetical protein [Clostridium botulinum]